jgi:hypothetical protein
MMHDADRDLFVRSLRKATEVSGAALDAALDELGWRDALEADPQVAVSALFDLQGRANATSSALDAVLGAGPGQGFVLPALGTWDPPGASGVALGHLLHCTTALVATASAAGPTVREVAVEDLSLRPVAGLDPSLGLVAVTAPEVGGGRPVDWPEVVAAGQRALGHELVGTARRMLELACEHALGRVQFGRPIAGFQAVRHRLAETLVAVEGADAAVAAAWEDGTPTSATLAKAVAGRSARTAGRHCQQVLAGIGFTTEHPFHHYLQRALVLDQLLGSSRLLTAAIGAEAIRTRRLPSMLPL